MTKLKLKNSAKNTNYGQIQLFDEGVFNDFFIATGTGETLKKKKKKNMHKQKVMYN